ncbi:MAG: DUF5663 domain-containing protein [Patescibacteria group bacterium]
MPIPDDIRTYLEGLLAESDTLTLDDSMREDMLQELFVQLENYLTSVIVNNLEPDDLEAFIKMNEEKKSKEEIEQFVQAKLPNAQDIFTNAFIEFRKMYVGNVQSKKGK